MQDVPNQIEDGSDRRGDHELQRVARHCDIRHLCERRRNLVGQGLAQGEGDVGDHKAIQELRYEGATGRPQPQKLAY